MAQTASARKVQLTIPPADTTMNEWLDVQYSAADSIRKLIRESVAREGFTDVANRPVRPPANPIYVAEDFPDEPPAPSAEEPGSARDEPAPAAKPVREPSPAPKPVRKPAPAAEDDGAEPRAAAPRTATPRTRRVQAADRSATDTINDILGL
ncbi:hypothetical protein LK09_01560 [Microbacterium mangrovi]|uniref:Uncharacterized protein n=1 Tax=Microbacterium mangrovi TaxID=1348253 RepID=A0A0B2A906_9MICO|nr:hypothetical protein [Microbacterium mangrovi]KHL00054.1 hypothetical protein LK09_01560 [Microbacterium mangrovi]